MTPREARPIDEFFVRYWDNALTADQAEELDRRLAADAETRAHFRQFCLHAVAAADLPAAAAPPRPTRRRVLRYLAAGAGAAAAGLLGWWSVTNRPASGVRLTSTRGAVVLRDAAGQLAPLSGAVPPGATLTTVGPSAAALLSYPDGTNVAISGDSIVAVADNGQRLLLSKGTASAEVVARTGQAGALTLATPEATMNEVSQVVLTLGHGAGGTEVGVHQGRVSVSAHSGEPLEVVRGGEVLTVQSGRRRHKQALVPAPEAMAWDFAQPLPADWHVGHRQLTPAGPVVVPELWFDPYHQTEMYQIRSDKRWSRGFCRLFPDSVVRVKYRVAQAGPSQVCFCVRAERLIDPQTAVVECNGAFAGARPGQWQWLEVKAADMLDNKHGPAFAAPWVAFLVIFNTYKINLGLEVAQLRVTRGPSGA